MQECPEKNHSTIFTPSSFYLTHHRAEQRDACTELFPINQRNSWSLAGHRSYECLGRTIAEKFRFRQNDQRQQIINCVPQVEDRLIRGLLVKTVVLVEGEIAMKIFVIQFVDCF